MDPVIEQILDSPKSRNPELLSKSALPLTDSTGPAYSVRAMMQQNVYRYYYYYGPLSAWRDGRDGLLLIS
jgi:hypothetical protein